jgi:polysaccharide export outer membrane protein
MTELRETDRSLLELTVTIPAAQRTRAIRGQQIGLLTAEQVRQPAVIRAKVTLNVKNDAASDFLLQPGDIVQVGPLFPPVPELPWISSACPRKKRHRARSHRGRLDRRKRSIERRVF